MTVIVQESTIEIVSLCRGYQFFREKLFVSFMLLVFLSFLFCTNCICVDKKSHLIHFAAIDSCSPEMCYILSQVLVISGLSVDINYYKN